MGQKVYLSMKTKTMWLIAEIITTRKITFHPGKQHRFFNSQRKFYQTVLTYEKMP